MSEDLENTLREMGPECRAVVARLTGAATAEDARRETEDGRGPETRDVRRGFASEVLCLKPYLTAASLLVLLGLGVFLLGRKDLRRETSDAGYGAREYRLTVDEMIATQNADGSWQNDFLTRRNAEALRVCGAPSARVAYKKAMRNLRSKGVL